MRGSNKLAELRKSFGQIRREIIQIARNAIVAHRPDDLQTVAFGCARPRQHTVQFDVGSTIAQAPADALANGADAELRERAVIVIQVVQMATGTHEVQCLAAAVDMVRTFKTGLPERGKQRCGVMSFQNQYSCARS